ncbi:MAG: ATP-binding protein [Rubripirellula sp.]
MNFSDPAANDSKSADGKSAVVIDTQSHHGSLRSKLVLSLASIFLIFLVVDEVVRRQVIQPEFVALERSNAIRDASRVLGAMNAEVEHLRSLTERWASRILKHDDLKQDYRVATQKYHWAVVGEPDGSWHWLHQGDDVNEKSRTKEMTEKLQELVDTCIASETGSVSGMTRFLKNSAMIFTVARVERHRSDGRHLIVGRYVDEALESTLRRQTQVQFTIRPTASTEDQQRLVVWERDESTLVVEIRLAGFEDQTLANIVLHVPRDITARARRTTALARNTFIFGCVAALLMLLLMLQRIVIGPLTVMREYSDRVAEHGLIAEPLELTGNDEIGHLGKAFGHMVRRLSNAQSQLTIASQAAGRSEVASTVIHNVGNVLTNVNSLIDSVSGRVQGLRISPLEKLAGRLRDTDNDMDLLKATPDYLEGLAGSLVSEQEQIGELLETLHDNVRHIHDVIRDQQRHASKSVDLSLVDVDAIVAEAIGCCRARLEQDAVAVQFAGSRGASVQTDRSLLLQVLINVIGNARHAMKNESGLRMMNISVHVGEERISVRIQDTGSGMTSKTLAKVFDAHFTTKETGSGLGLHFCALTLKRLGGAVRATSEGLGKGSTFEIELPFTGSSASTATVIPTLSSSLPSTPATAEA